MAEYLILIGKILFLFIYTLFCFRLMGYRSIGDMEPLDYVIVLSIGEIVGSPICSKDSPIIYAIIGITVLTGLQLLFTSLYRNSSNLNKIIEGEPVPVISNGKIIMKNLEKHRISVNDIMEELRIKGLRDESDVDIAYLEPSGRFSVIMKSCATPITPRYLGMDISYQLISKGKTIPAQWEMSSVTVKEVADFLEEERINDLNEIQSLFYRAGEFLLEKVDSKEI